LEMLDELQSWGLEPPVVCADAASGEITAFRLGLETRGRAYVLQVQAQTSAFAADARPEPLAYAGTGRPSRPRYRDKPRSLRELALAAAAEAAVEVSWREGTTGKLRSRFLALRVRPANKDIPRDERGALPLRWLLCEWPDGAAEPVKYWLSNLPGDVPLERLLRLAKLRWRGGHRYRRA